MKRTNYLFQHKHLRPAILLVSIIAVGCGKQAPPNSKTGQVPLPAASAKQPEVHTRPTMEVNQIDVPINGLLPLDAQILTGLNGAKTKSINWHGGAAIIALFLIFELASGAEIPPLDGTQPPRRDYNETGRKLPPGVPRTVDTNGNVTYIRGTFTTPLYQAAALNIVLQEANRVAQNMQLEENLPITKSNITDFYIGPFGSNYAKRRIGNITTKNYSYGIEQGDKFSNLTVANYNQTCLSLKNRPALPVAQIDTNTAYQIATQWLSQASMDVKSLNRDCQVKVEISGLWNDTPNGEKLTKPKFVPIYDVSWLSPQNQAKHYGDVAFVELYLPTKTLLQLSIQDSRYILRKPLVFTNLAELFPGVALIQTNHPVKPTPGPVLPRVQDPPPGDPPGPPPSTDK